MSINVPYDSAGFDTLLTSIEQRLGELKYIDDTLAYIGVRHEFTGPPLILEIGWTYPFESTKFMSRVSEEDITAHVKSLANDGPEWAAGIVEGVRTTIEPLTESIPARFDGVAEQLEADVGTPLPNQIPDDFGKLQHSLSEWKGDAAENFATNFYQPYLDCVDNQAWLANGIALQLGAAGSVIKMGRHSLMNVATATDRILDDQLQQRHDQNTPQSLKETLKIISFATGLLAIATAPAPPISAGLTTVSAVTGYAQSELPEEDSADTEVEGAKAPRIAASFEDLMSTAITKTDAAWDALREGTVKELANHLVAVEGEGLLVPPRPDLADGGLPPGDFYHD